VASQGGDDLLVGRGGRNFLIGGPGADTARRLLMSARSTPARSVQR
jgi:hypothetical protein